MSKISKITWNKYDLTYIQEGKMAAIKNIGHINPIFHVHNVHYFQDIQSFCDQACGQEVSTEDDNNVNNDDGTQRTIHDCKGSLAFMPNEPVVDA